MIDYFIIYHSCSHCVPFCTNPIIKFIFSAGATHAHSAGLSEPCVYFYLFSAAAVVFIPVCHYSQL